MIDLEGLIARLGGDPGLVLSLLESFIRDAPGLIQGLGAAVEAADFDRARHLTHTLKGTLLWVGAAASASAASALEERLVSRPRSSPDAELATLTSSVDALLQSLPSQILTLRA